MEAAAILGPDKEGEDMKTEHSYSAKGVLAALGRSALYLLFFVAVQVLLPFVYGIGIAADAAINRGADLAQGAQALLILGHGVPPIGFLQFDHANQFDCQHTRPS